MTSDPRALLRQLQTQTAANRYARLLREANAKAVDRVVRDANRRS